MRKPKNKKNFQIEIKKILKKYRNINKEKNIKGIYLMNDLITSNFNLLHNNNI